MFSRVFHAAGQRVAADVPATMALGFPWAAAELLARETPRLPLIGRFDFVQERTADGGRWRLLELNADTPSGVREGIGCDCIVADLLSEAAGLVRPSASLQTRFVAAVVDALGLGASSVASGGSVVPRGGALGIVTTASELEDLSQMAYTADLLRPDPGRTRRRRRAGRCREPALHAARTDLTRASRRCALPVPAV